MLPNDTPTTGGLYLLRFPNGDYYGGRSQNIRSRCHLHSSQLRNGTHANPWMQRVYDKYGQPAIEVLSAIPQKEARVLAEQAWLDENVGRPGCLNLSRSADSNAMEGRHHSEETRRLISNRLRGREFTEEHRRALSDSATGRQLSSDAGAKIADANRSRVWTNAAKERSSASHTGKRHTAETRMKMAESARLREARKREACLE